MVKYIEVKKNGIIIKQPDGRKELTLYDADCMVYDFENKKGFVYTNDDITHEFIFSKYIINKIKKEGGLW